MTDLENAINGALSKGDLAAAEKVCLAAIIENDADWRAHYWLGITYRARGDFRAALASYQTALKTSPIPGPILTACGIAYQQLGDFSQAIAAFATALQLEPESACTLNSLALTQKLAGKPHKAVYNYCLALDAALQNAWQEVRKSGGVVDHIDERGRKVLVAIPGFESVFADAVRAGLYFTIVGNIGAVFEGMGQPDRASMFYRHANCKAPFDESFVSELMTEAQLADRALACLKKEDLDGAIADYTVAIRLDPKVTDAHYNRGIAYATKGDWDKAIADYTETIRLDPKNAKAYVERSRAYVEKGEMEKALADFTEAIRFDPKYDPAYTKREKALADSTEAIRLNPDDADAYNERGVAYRAKGELDKALADFVKAILLDPKNAKAYYNRGLVYAMKGELDKAIADYSEAIRLDPKNADAYNERARSYWKQGDWDRVIADYTEILRLDPNNADAYNYRGAAYTRKGDWDEWHCRSFSWVFAQRQGARGWSRDFFKRICRVVIGWDCWRDRLASRMTRGATFPGRVLRESGPGKVDAILSTCSVTTNAVFSSAPFAPAVRGTPFSVAGGE